MSTRLVTFTLDERLFGVEVNAVQEVLRGQPQTRIPLAPDSVSGLINLRGQVLSAVELRARLGLPDRMATATVAWQAEIAALGLAAGPADLHDRADRILQALG